MEQPAPTGVSLTSDSVQPRHQTIWWKWSLIIVLLLFGYFVWRRGSGMRAAALLSDDALRHFHSQLDSEAYADILRESDEACRNSANGDPIIEVPHRCPFKGGHSPCHYSYKFSWVRFNAGGTGASNNGGSL